MAVFMTGGQAATMVNYVGWLQSSGTQWIKNGYYSPTMVVTFDIAFTQLVSTWQMNGWANALQAGIDPNGYWHNQNTSTVKATLNQRYKAKIEVSTKKLYVDDVLVATGVTALTVPMAIGGAISSNGQSVNFLSCEKIYGCQTHDNGILVCDLRPCYDPDGVACMYDKVSETYFYNAGTGQFIAGGAP